MVEKRVKQINPDIDPDSLFDEFSNMEKEHQRMKAFPNRRVDNPTPGPQVSPPSAVPVITTGGGFWDHHNFLPGSLGLPEFVAGNSDALYMTCISSLLILTVLITVITFYYKTITGNKKTPKDESAGNGGFSLSWLFRRHENQDSMDTSDLKLRYETSPLSDEESFLLESNNTFQQSFFEKISTGSGTDSDLRIAEFKRSTNGNYVMINKGGQDGNAFLSEDTVPKFKIPKPTAGATKPRTQQDKVPQFPLFENFKTQTDQKVQETLLKEDDAVKMVEEAGDLEIDFHSCSSQAAATKNVNFNSPPRTRSDANPNELLASSTSDRCTLEFDDSDKEGNMKHPEPELAKQAQGITKTFKEECDNLNTTSTSISATFKQRDSNFEFNYEASSDEEGLLKLQEQNECAL